MTDLEGIPVEAVMPLQDFLGLMAAERTRKSARFDTMV